MADSQEAELSSLRSLQEARARQLSDSLRMESESSTRSIDAALRELSRSYAADKAKFQANAAGILANYPVSIAPRMVFIKPDGSASFSTVGNGMLRSGIDPEFASALANASNDKLLIGKPFIATFSGEQLIAFARPLFENGRYAGALAIPVPPKALFGQILETAGAHEEFELTNDKGEAIANSSRTIPLAGFKRAHIADNPKDDHGSWVQPENPSASAHWSRLGGYPLTAVAILNEYHPLEEAKAAHKVQKLQAAGGIAIIIALAALASMQMLRLLRHRKSSIESEKQNRILFDGSKSPMFLIDPSTGSIVKANKAACQFYGYSLEMLVGMKIASINTLPQQEIEKEMAAAVAERRDFFNFRHRLASGNIREVEVHAAPIEIEGKTYLYSIVHDATERHELERRLKAEAQRLGAILATSADGMHVLDCSGFIVQHSDSFAKMLGRDGENMIGTHVSEWDAQLTHAEQAAKLKEISGDELALFETIHRRKDGSTFPVEILTRGFSIDGRRLIYAAARDITERRIHESEQRIAAVAFESQEGMVITDNRGNIKHCNEAFTRITGYSREEAVGSNPSFLQSGRHGKEFYKAMWSTVLEQGQWAGEIWNKRKSGEIYPEWLSITAVKNPSGEVSHYVGSITDITQRKRDEAEIRTLAFYDPLTKLPNRRLLGDRMDSAIAIAKQGTCSIGLLFIDLDNFKSINDSLGHDAGDELLCQVADRIAGCSRQSDTVARLGGDEFIVLLANLPAQLDMAATVAETVGRKIIAALSADFQVRGKALKTSPSIGAICADGTLSSGEMLKRADAAMYQAKEAGRNTLRFYDPQMQADAEERSAKEAQVLAAIKADEFTLHFQPIANAEGAIVGAEALARWPHPTRGLIPPTEFIPLAEQIGAIDTLGSKLMRIAFERLSVWKADPQLSQLTLSINVSSIQFHQQDFVSKTLAAMEQTGVDPEKVKLEITESLLLSDISDAISKMKKLSSRGISFSIDDFGTGYSSLYYLKRLPLRQLKIDRSFVSDLPMDANDAAIASMVISLAKHLHLDVVAEGVENKQQMDFLAGMGCNRFQGYLISKPIAVEAFEALVKAQRHFD